MLASLTLLLLVFSQISAQTDSALSAKDRQKVFQNAWERIRDKYYDPKLNGVDWSAMRDKYQPLANAAQSDQQFYYVVKRMVGEIKDAHTRFLTPREARDFKNQQGTGVGILLGQIEGKTVVLYVLKDSLADQSGVKPGMTIETVDQRAVADLMPEILQNVGVSSSERAGKILAARRLLEGEPGTNVALGLSDENGKRLEVVLTRKTIDNLPKSRAKILDSGIGYISLNTFRGNAFEVFKNELATIKETNGLIVDLRYNGGGNIVEVLKIAGLFAPKDTSFGEMFRRSQKTIPIKALGGDKPFYSAPLVILVNEFSASGSELFSGGLQEAGRAAVIGTQTCGCLLGINNGQEFTGGSVLQMSELGFRSAQKKVFEKIGITPDETVPVTIKFLLSPEDEDITEAENYLKSRQMNAAH